MSDPLTEAGRNEIVREVLHDLAKDLRALTAGPTVGIVINAAAQVEQTAAYLYAAQAPQALQASQAPQASRAASRAALAAATKRALVARNNLDVATSYVATTAPEALVDELVEAHVCTVEAEVVFRLAALRRQENGEC